jgi:hypothetical protein
MRTITTATTLSFAVGIIGLTCMAQTTTPKTDPSATPKAASEAKPKPGIVSGRIFLITKGGDIKPARLASVYLVSWDGAKNSAAQRWDDEYLRASQGYLAKLLDPQWSESTACKMELLAYDQATLAVLQSDAPSQLKILTGHADEEGNFKMADVQPGLYMIVASARAGFNDARWEEGFVQVKSEMETSLKLASPAKACLDLQ